MTRLVSTPLTITVLPALALGTGSEAGRFADDLWTPGRDAEGTINSASWKLVPKGRWLQVAGTRLDALDAVVKAAVAGWRDFGSSNWNGVTHAWNGVALDEAGCRAWWICCGGHGDSSNNGIYRFDALKMRYAVEKMPSDSTRWSEAYRHVGTFTLCPESAAAAAVKAKAGTLKPIDDWFYDEVYWDRQPTARHVYSGVVYSASTDELLMAVRRLWRYSLASGKWTYKRLPNDSQNGNFGEEVIAALDASGSELIVGACGSGGPYGGTFDLKRLEWTGYSPPWASWSFSGAADCRNGDLLTIIKPPENPASGPYASPGRYLRYDLRTRRTESSGDLHLAAGLKQAAFKADHDGCGMVYVPPLNRYWMAVLMTATNRMGWVEVDPTTTPWTLRPLQHQGAVPALDGSTLVRRRMVWLPALNAVLWLGSANREVALYRV